MKNILLNIDSIGYTEKPSEFTKEISARLNNSKRRLTIKELAYKVAENGQSFTSCSFNGTRCSEHFQQSIIKALDFDATTNADAIKLKCKVLGLKPSIIYPTFSDIFPNNPLKFRLIFQMDTPIYDYKINQLITDKLLEIFPEADKACADPTHIFFGGKSLCYLDEHASITIEQLNAISPFEEIKENNNIIKARSVLNGTYEKTTRIRKSLGYYIPNKYADVVFSKGTTNATLMETGIAQHYYNRILFENGTFNSWVDYLDQYSDGTSDTFNDSQQTKLKSLFKSCEENYNPELDSFLHPFSGNIVDNSKIVTWKTKDGAFRYRILNEGLLSDEDDFYITESSKRNYMKSKHNKRTNQKIQHSISFQAGRILSEVFNSIAYKASHNTSNDPEMVLEISEDIPMALSIKYAKEMEQLKKDSGSNYNVNWNTTYKQVIEYILNLYPELFIGKTERIFTSNKIISTKLIINTSKLKELVKKMKDQLKPTSGEYIIYVLNNIYNKYIIQGMDTIYYTHNVPSTDLKETLKHPPDDPLSDFKVQLNGPQSSFCTDSQPAITLSEKDIDDICNFID